MSCLNGTLEGENMKKVCIIILVVITIIAICIIKCNKSNKILNNAVDVTYNNLNILENQNVVNVGSQSVEKVDITDWKLTLVNYENSLPEDFEPELAYIDKTRQFDLRAIDELKQMMNDMKNDGIQNVWIQSSYRSVKRQKELFDRKINTYISQGKTREEAENLTLKVINKPGTSDHNLGLAVDFNYVDYNFDKTKGYEWLKENAENYGFVLRYPKEKVDITKVNYEPWHWRYVGKENAIKMNELDMCLEEYIEYNK